MFVRIVGILLLQSIKMSINETNREGTADNDVACAGCHGNHLARNGTFDSFSSQVCGAIKQWESFFEEMFKRFETRTPN